MGHRSLRECQEAISSREFSEWMAYDRLSPIGPERIDVQLSTFMALFANANRNPKKAGKFKVSTFLPAWLRPQRIAQTWQTLEEKMRAFTVAMGGSVNEADGGEWSGEGTSSPPSTLRSAEDRRHRG